MPLVDGAATDGPHLESSVQSTHHSHRWAASSDPELISSALSWKVEAGGEDCAVEITNMVDAHKFPATDHRRVVLVMVDENSGQVVWEEQVAIPAGSTVSWQIRRPAVWRGLTIQLRYYPAPEVGSDQFFLIGTRKLGE